MCPPSLPTFYQAPTSEYAYRPAPQALGVDDLVLTFTHRLLPLPSGLKLRIRDYEFKVRPGLRRRPIAHGRFTGIEPIAPAGASQLKRLARQAPLEYQEALELLIAACPDHEGLFRTGGVLILEYFELRSDVRGRGLGKQIAHTILRRLAQRSGAVLALWKAYPLQYLETPPSTSEQERAFEQARRALEVHYCKNWGARRIGVTGWLGLELNRT